MNAFEPLIWMSGAWCVIRAIRTGDGRYWLGFGVLAGIGMENKYSIVFFIAGVAVGLLLSPERRFLAKPLDVDRRTRRIPDCSPQPDLAGPP